jgi:hypothetical protein
MWSGANIASRLLVAADATGIVTHHALTAGPLKPQETGVRAFCTDQSGVVLYDLNGSAFQCIALRQNLFDGPRRSENPSN